MNIRSLITLTVCIALMGAGLYVFTASEPVSALSGNVEIITSK